MFETTIVYPGIYVIADPSYVLNNKRYDKLVEPASMVEHGYTLIEHKNGKELVCHSMGTAHGDGQYAVHRSSFMSSVQLLSDVCELPVDVGMIAITSIELATDYDHDEKDPLGILIEVLEPIVIQKCDGALNFGPFTVDTDPEYFEEDDYDDFEENDEDENEDEED